MKISGTIHLASHSELSWQLAEVGREQTAKSSQTRAYEEPELDGQVNLARVPKVHAG